MEIEIQNLEKNMNDIGDGAIIKYEGSYYIKSDYTTCSPNLHLCVNLRTGKYAKIPENADVQIVKGKAVIYD